MNTLNTHKIYSEVIRVVRYFITHAAHLSIEELKDYDPSIEELANDIKELARIIRAFAASDYDDQNLAINALQCCFELESLASAVSNEDSNQLDEIFARLKMHVDAPV